MALDFETAYEAFPLLVRVCGLITTLVLIGFCLAGFYIQAAPGFVPAAGMLLYPYLHSAAKDKKGDEDDDDKTLAGW